MIVDTSAVMAVLLAEEDRSAFLQALAEAGAVSISAATLVETRVVAAGRLGVAVWDDLDALLARAEVEVVPFTAEHAALAREGWRRYGKGHHPAALNLGDCFAYALAKARNEPLLFKGKDFAQTDVKAAI